MKGLFTKDIVVLDVASRLINVIVGVKRAQSVFGIKSVVVKEHPGYEDGRWFAADETEQQVKQALSDAMRSADSNSRRLFIGVHSEFATVVNKDVSINLDRRRHIADDDIDYLIARGKDFDEKNYICANTAAVYYSIDGDEKLITDVRGMTAQRVSARISYMLAEKRFVSMFDRIASDLGFRDVRYIVSDWAQCVMLLDEEQREDSFALLNIGYLSSSVTLAKGEGLLGMRSFSVGGGHISADIYSALEVPFDLAQEAKDMLDLNLNYAEDAVLVRDDNYIIYAGDACEIAKSRLNMLADVIATIFKDFAEDAPSYLPIYLTGDGIASMRGAKKYLSEKLKKNIEILTPTLPGFITAKDSSKTALLLMADTLSGGSLGDMIKSIFSGGKK